jgi:hypothetical protein
LERHVGVVLVVASSRHRSIIIAAAADGRARQECVLELVTSSSSCPRRSADGLPSRGTWQDGRLRVAESRALLSRPPEAVGEATDSRPPILRRFRLPRLRLPAETPVAGEIDGLSVDAERATGSGFWCCPAAPAIITYPGWRSPGCSRFPRHWRGQGSTPVVAEVRGSAPERSGEHSVAVDAADRSGAAPELAGPKRVASSRAHRAA